MKNQTITTSHLEEIGINPLTGEADAYYMGRILCDLNEQGKETVREYFGLSHEAFLPNWNSMVGGQPAVASIMLQRDTWSSLILFSLLRQGYDYVAVGGDAWIAMSNDDPATAGLLERVQKLEELYRLYSNVAKRSSQPSVGGRNVHQFTGRVE